MEGREEPREINEVVFFLCVGFLMGTGSVGEVV